MRSVLLIVALLLLFTSSVFAVGDQAYLGIFAETKVQKMPGMPAMPEMPDLPPGIDLSSIPGLSALMGGGAERLLEVRLWSPGLAPADAFARITPPAGLKQGNKLVLDLYRPKPGQTSSEVNVGGEEFDPEKIEEFTIKVYWGSSETVKPGQPKIIKWGDMTAAQKGNMKEQAAKAAASGGYFYKPNWTTGYWPTKKQPGKVGKDASLVGKYALETNYTGSCELEAPKNVDFLAPFDLTSPNLEKQIALEKAIALKWKPILNALGLHAMAFGMEGRNTLIIWSSAENFTDAMMATDFGYLQMAEVKQFVSSKVMMPGDTTAVTIPSGIFKKCDMSMLNMVGYGPGAALAEGQPLPRIQTKTTLGMMLGGSGMPSMDE